MSWLRSDGGDTLDGALAVAAQRGVPLLVLWTAAWCPPCNELQLMVFDDPLFAPFAERIVLFRLDGDSPGAQAVGDRLGVRAYPTALLLDPQGRERLRLPGGLTAAEYGRALELAIADDEVLESRIGRLLRGEPPGARDCELLAFHWWQVDDRSATGANRLALLQRLHSACPDPLAQARLRLLVQWLIAAAAQRDAPPHEADAWGRALREALASPAATYSNLYFLLVDLSVLRVLGEAVRAEVETTLAAAIEALLAAQGLAWTERLIALSALLALARRRDGGPDDALRERIREAVQQADAESVTTPQRQTVVNMAGHLLKAAGFVDASLALFEAEAAVSPHAGYFWPYVAQTRFEQGRTDEAIAAWRQAWQATPAGCARRVRGAAYVARLAEIRPAERALVESEALAVLREFAPAADALAGRHRQALLNLLQALRVVAAC